MVPLRNVPIIRALSCCGYADTAHRPSIYNTITVEDQLGAFRVADFSEVLIGLMQDPDQVSDEIMCKYTVLDLYAFRKVVSRAQ